MIGTNLDKLEAVARCLAKLDGQFISAERWADVEGFSAIYRDRAAAVLMTIDNFESGVRSGGLPPRTGVLR